MKKYAQNKILQFEILAEIRKKPHGTIGFCSGCFDILHSGHVVFFEQAKEKCDALVVSVGSDSVIRALKGPGRPVNPENNRLFLLAGLESVDYVILGGEDKDMRPGKIDFYETFKALRPDVYILNDDDSAIKEKTALCQETGTKLEFVARTVPPLLAPTSSTKIIRNLNL
jgi:D-beta-D-heptose 7-phosphate kinase/D-beta-D-heptose 1-phosphate adenosyltransferase